MRTSVYTCGVLVAVKCCTLYDEGWWIEGRVMCAVACRKKGRECAKKMFIDPGRTGGIYSGGGNPIKT